MTSSSKKNPSRRLLTRLMKYAFLASITVLLLALLILVFLPTLISRDASRRLIVENVSDMLDRPVRIERLAWSWTDGLLIDDLVIPDEPAFSQDPMVVVDHLRFTLDILQLLRTRIDVVLDISGMDINVIRNDRGELNIQTLGKMKWKKPNAPVEKKTDQADRTEEDRPLLPSAIEDVSIKTHLSRINLRYEDRLKDETVGVRDLDIRIDSPSVRSGTVSMKLGAVLAAYDHAFPRSTLDLCVTDLFDADGGLALQKAAVRLDAHLPGIAAGIGAHLATSTWDAHMQIDLAPVMQALGPLIADGVTQADIKGRIACKVSGGIQPTDPLAFSVDVTGSDITVAGELIGGKSVGPAGFHVRTDGVMDLSSDRLDLKTVDIRLLEKSRMKAQATIEKIQTDDRTIHLVVSDLAFDLDELIALARPFVPSPIEIQEIVKSNATLSLKRLIMEGQLAAGHADMKVDNLCIRLPTVAVRGETKDHTRLTVAGTRVDVHGLAVRLKDRVPSSAEISLSVNIDEVERQTDQQAIFVSGIRLDRLTMDAKQLAKADDQMVGIIGNIRVGNQLTIDRIRLPGLVEMAGLTQSVQGFADLRKNGSIKGRLAGLDVNSKQVTIWQEGLEWTAADLSLHLTADNLLARSLSPIDAVADHVTADVRMGNALTIALAADIAHGETTRIDTDLTVASDLDTLLKKIPPTLLPDVAGAGSLVIALHANAHRPNEREIQALTTMKLAGNLSFIDRLDLTVRLENGALVMDRKNADPITIAAIQGHPLIGYDLRGNSGKGKIASVITADAVSGLPGIDPPRPIPIRFTLSGDHEYANTVALKQSLSLDTAGLQESMDISLDGLDAFLSQKTLPSLSALLRFLGARISAGLTVSQWATVEKLGVAQLSAATIKGGSDARFHFRLVPDQSIGGDILVSTRDMDVDLPDWASIIDLDTHLAISKSYGIRRPLEKEIPFPSTGLSRRVLGTEGREMSASGNRKISRHIRLTQERMNPTPTVAFRTADVHAAPFPLHIDESMIMMRADEALPALDYFQFNLLGGTINGTMDLGAGKANGKRSFNVNTTVTFSGIDTAQLFPGTVSQEDPGETQISGSLQATIPVTNQIRPLMEEMTLTIDFSRIGSKALDRLLYAIDPYENNEAIVSQRQLLKNGSPTHFRVAIKAGFLSLQGQVSVKGIDIAMPTVQRLNVARLPGMNRFEAHLGRVTPLLDILNTLSSDTIVVSGKEDLVFTSE